MSKNKEYSANGVREFYSVKGCNSCSECEHLSTQIGVFNNEYFCKAKRGKTSLFDRRFPYDNTKCKEFKKVSE